MRLRSSEDKRSKGSPILRRFVVACALMLVPALASTAMTSTAFAGAADGTQCTTYGISIVNPDDPNNCYIAVPDEFAGYNVTNPPTSSGDDLATANFIGTVYSEQANGDGNYTDNFKESLFVANVDGHFTISSAGGPLDAPSDGADYNGSAACVSLAVVGTLTLLFAIGFFSSGAYIAFGGATILGYAFTVEQLNLVGGMLSGGTGIVAYIRSLIGC